MTHEAAGPGLAEVDKLLDRAIQHVCDLSAGRKTWRMSIPAQGDDSDIVLIDALTHAKSALRAATAPQDGPICEWDSVVEDETGDYSTSCGKEFQSLDGEPPTFIKFCCYCGKPVTILPAAPQVAQEGQPWWMYYELPRETLIKMLNEQSAQLVALREASRPQEANDVLDLPTDSVWDSSRDNTHGNRVASLAALDVLRAKKFTIPIHGHSTCAADPVVVKWADVESALLEASRLASPPAPTDLWCDEKYRKDNPALVGCTGKGRPTCTATECFYGVETCPECGKAKSVGSKCGYVHLAASPPETAPALDLDKLALHPYRISRGNWTRCPVTDESEFEPCDDADVVTVREALLVCRQLATEIERLRAAAVASPPETAPI